MADKPLRPCRHPGCCELTSSGYCPAHRPKKQRGDEAEAWHRWYLLPLWKRDLRPEQLMREPYCRECARKGWGRVPATEVDHIVPHRGVWERFTDRDNLQSLCHRCHSAKTMRELREIKAKNAQF